MTILTKSKFLEAINLWVLPSTLFKNPSKEDFFKALYKMGYQDKLKGVVDFKKRKLLVFWKFICHYMIQCLSGRIGGTDAMRIQLLDLLWSIFIGKAIDYGTIH